MPYLYILINIFVFLSVRFAINKLDFKTHKSTISDFKS